MSTGIFDVSGHVVVISGASRGLGREIARQFLGQGAMVAMGGYDAAEVAQAVSVLTGEFGERVAGHPGDIADPAVANDLVSLALDRFGRVDHVVCNAGIDIIKPAVEYTPGEWEKILAVNLGGSFHLAQAAARHWIAHARRGSIAITSSIAGSVGIPTLAPYAASKGGVNQLVRTLAVEWAPHGIRVNAVAPGYIDNIMDGVTAHRDPRSEERIRLFTPMGRRATLEEIAAPFVFLASPAAGYITGAILAVDGGYTAL